MRQVRSSRNRDHNDAQPSRALRAGVPVIVAGSIALTLSASPAQAATTDTASRAAESIRGVRPITPLPSTPRMTPAAVLAADVRVTAEAAPATYTVQRGDTVSRIAARFGLRTSDVLALNGLGWSSTIYPGQVLTLSGAVTATPSQPPAAATPAAATYTVQGGDTISAIARRHGTTINAVLAANGLALSSIIYPGQTLSIPGAASPGESVPAPAPAPSTSTAGAHTVAAGDTISAIARQYGTTTTAVLAANGLGWSSIIYPGQTLRIPGTSESIPGLSAEQVGNAQLIVRIGRELGVSDRGIAIALGTAMQESSLRNVTWGDRDSLGLFQQRPSYGWGTEAEVQDAVRSTRVFFGGAGDPNGSRTRGLLDIPGWDRLTFAQAAQAVQNSAYPDAYARWETSAHAWLAALG